jgi:hypothetical protein
MTEIAVTLTVSVRVDHVMESRDVMNIHVVEHSILNGIEYCTFWFRSAVEMTRHQLLLHLFNMLTIFRVAHPDQTALTL